MERTEAELSGSIVYWFAAELVRHKPVEGPEPPAKVVGRNEVVGLLSELGVIIVTIALLCSFFDHPVHALDYAAGKDDMLLYQAFATNLGTQSALDACLARA